MSIGMWFGTKFGMCLDMNIDIHAGNCIDTDHRLYAWLHFDRGIVILYLVSMQTQVDPMRRICSFHTVRAYDHFGICSVSCYPVPK